MANYWMKTGLILLTTWKIQTKTIINKTPYPPEWLKLIIDNDRSSRLTNTALGKKGIKTADGINVADWIRLQMELRLLISWLILGGNPGLSRWTQCNHKACKREGKRQKRTREDSAQHCWL